MNSDEQTARVALDYFKNNLIALGEGNRNNPIAFAFHLKFGYVPVIQFLEDYVIWDDNQITRETPPSPLYESSPYSDFDIFEPIYNKNQNLS